MLAARFADAYDALQRARAAAVLRGGAEGGFSTPPASPSRPPRAPEPAQEVDELSSSDDDAGADDSDVCFVLGHGMSHGSE